MNAAGVSQTCVNDVSSCGFSPGKETVEFLATDNDVFVEEFIVAFTKMIEKVRRSMSGKIFLPKVQILRQAKLSFLRFTYNVLSVIRSKEFKTFIWTIWCITFENGTFGSFEV